jgi:hypothetical protein
LKSHAGDVRRIRLIDEVQIGFNPEKLLSSTAYWKVVNEELKWNSPEKLLSSAALLERY